jgi:hypothetical protein
MMNFYLTGEGKWVLRVWTGLNAPSGVQNWCDLVAGTDLWMNTDERINFFFGVANLTYSATATASGDSYACNLSSLSLSEDTDLQPFQHIGMCDWSGLTITVSEG